MCRPRDFDTEGGRIPRRRSLKIDSVGFHLKKLSSAGGGGCGGVEEADWVSLVLMPRMDGSPLVVNGSKIAADMPTFITLHRVTNNDTMPTFITLHRVTNDTVTATEAVFRSSRDTVEGVCDGLSFELHLGQHCLVRGVFRCCKSDNKKRNGDWKMDCKWVANPEIGGLLAIREAVLSVGDLTERIQIRSRCRRSKRWRGKRCASFKMCLQDIPEVDEDDDDDDDEFVCYCNCGHEYEDDMIKMEDDYGWAVDASFWALCVGLGLGYMVSRTSKRTLNLSKFLPL